MDEAQSCGNRPLGEEEGYDADSESNPADMAKQEEGRSTQTERVSDCTQLLMYAGSCSGTGATHDNDVDFSAALLPQS